MNERTDVQAAVERKWTYCPECGCDEVHYEVRDHKQCKRCHQEWFADVDYTQVVKDNLASRHSLSPASEEPVGEALLPKLVDRFLNHMRDDPFTAWRDVPPSEWAPSMKALRESWLADRSELMRDLFALQKQLAAALQITGEKT